MTRVSDHLPKCQQCGQPFENFGDRTLRVCSTCHPQTGQSVQIDSWQYMRSGVGFRLTAGFNMREGVVK
jgi:protein-arginine kinase activator protein McsA